MSSSHSGDKPVNISLTVAQFYQSIFSCTQTARRAFYLRSRPIRMSFPRSHSQLPVPVPSWKLLSLTAYVKKSNKMFRDDLTAKTSCLFLIVTNGVKKKQF